MPIAVAPDAEATTLQPQDSTWKCGLGYNQHDVFISYRVSADKEVATELHSALSAHSANEDPIHTFLDRACIPTATEFERQFINGLRNSRVIVLLLSKEGLEKSKKAHKTDDNFFLEIQLAIQQIETSKGTPNPVLLQPIFLYTRIHANNMETLELYYPKPEDFPDQVPCHPLTPTINGAKLTMHDTIRRVMKLQALLSADSNSIRRLVPRIKELLSKARRVSTMDWRNVPKGYIISTADETRRLRDLLRPIESDEDLTQLQKAFVPGTRQWLFDSVLDWADGHDGNQVLWIQAIAGVGKSVAAAQIANILQSRNQLVTSIFLKYNNPRKSNPRDLLTTIAYGLCTWYGEIGRRLLSTMVQGEAGARASNGPRGRSLTRDDLDKMDIRELFKTIILDPLQAVGDDMPKGAVIIIIDGLDECYPRDEILGLLSNDMQNIGTHQSWLKLLITARPEPDIKEALASIQTKEIVPTSENNIKDLELYIHHRLKMIDTLSFGEKERKEAVDIMLNKSSSYLGFLSQSRYDPDKTFVSVNLLLNSLEKEVGWSILTMEKIKQVTGGSQNLPDLYNKTFALIYRQSKHQDALETVISAIATAQSTLTPRSIAEIFKLDIETVRECLKSLSLVLDLGANGLGLRDSQSTNTEVKFNHKSVADYLLGDNSKNEAWHVSSSFHTVFAKGCLGVILSHEPVINICDIYDFRDKIPDFEDKVAAKITPSQRYSVAHWITHFVWCLEGATESSSVWGQTEFADVAAVLTRFVKTHVFFWLECGSLTHVVKSIIGQLAVLRGVIANAPKSTVDDITKELVKDTYRFIREFADPIIASAPQVYNSGYAFTPKETAIYKTYANRLEDKIPFLVTAGPAPTWDPCDITMSSGKNGISSVTLTPDGRMIVSGSGDNTIKVWDAITGQLKNTLRGHTASVGSVCVSFDGKVILSGSNDNDVKVWTINGRLQATLKGHTGWVTSVAISNSGKWIVSGSKDKTIKVWDAARGEVKHTLEGHTGTVTAVALTKDERYIVSASLDRTIRIWDLPAGRSTRVLEEQDNAVISVAVSGDSKLIASGSDSGPIKLWHFATGKLKTTLSGHSEAVNSVTFIPDGYTLVSGSKDRSVMRWDAAAGQHVRTLMGHSDSVKSVVISSDGNTVVSGSYDTTIRIWDSNTVQTRRQRQQHQGVVRSFVTSENDETLVSASADETLMIWDAITGKHKYTLEGHKGIVTSTCISRDSRMVISGSNDKTVKVWDAVSGRLKQTLEGHDSNVISVRIASDRKTIVSKDAHGQTINWTLKQGEFTRASNSFETPSMSGKAPLNPDRWSLVDTSSSNWIRHDMHMLKVPHAYFGWEGRQTSTLGTLRMWNKSPPCHFVAIHPIYQDNQYMRFLQAYYYENRQGSPQLLVKASELYRCTLSDAYPESAYHLALVLERENPSKEQQQYIFQGFSSAASKSHVDAKFRLGQCYENGTWISASKSEALSLYKQAAADGSFDALFHVARCYENGIGTFKNISTAVKWYHAAADLWHQEAEYILGDYYETGQGVGKNPTLAFYWYQRAAQQGHVLAQNALGRLYEEGIGVEANKSLSLDWFNRAADQGHPESKVAALRLWQVNAESGSAEYQFKLGCNYESGVEVPVNLAAAFSWFDKAAAQGYPEAQFRLARCYEFELGCVKSVEMAFHWYSRAASNNSVGAMYHLGRCYEVGIGTTPNSTKAFDCYKKADNGQNIEACISLGRCYENAFGTSKDFPKAFEAYHRAAERGSIEARHQVARCYEYGIGTTKEPERAFQAYLTASTSNGGCKSTYDVGRCYENGIGTPKNLERAAKYYMDAAGRGSTDAHYALGLMYGTGMGVERSQTRAQEHFSSAAEHGHQGAKIRLYWSSMLRMF